MTSMHKESLMLFLVLVNAGIAHCAPANDTNAVSAVGMQLPSNVGSHPIDEEVRDAANRLPTIGMQLSYLSTIVTRSAGQEVTENRRKASAVRLLGVLAKTNSIDLLALQIAFKDVGTQSYPAVYAVANIGEQAVPKLLSVVGESTNEVAIANSVKALLLIEGTNFDRFVLSQRKVLPPRTSDRLLKYAVWD